MSMSRIAAPILLATLMTGTVCAEDKSPHREHSSAGGSQALHEAMMPGMNAMHSMKMTGDIDKDYSAMMIKHHEQANAMNKVYLSQGKNPELKAMAEKMLSEQTKEIEQLKKHK